MWVLLTHLFALQLYWDCGDIVTDEGTWDQWIHHEMEALGLVLVRRSLPSSSKNPCWEKPERSHWRVGRCYSGSELETYWLSTQLHDPSQHQSFSFLKEHFFPRKPGWERSSIAHANHFLYQEKLKTLWGEWHHIPYNHFKKSKSIEVKWLYYLSRPYIDLDITTYHL